MKNVFNCHTCTISALNLKVVGTGLVGVDWGGGERGVKQSKYMEYLSWPDNCGMGGGGGVKTKKVLGSGRRKKKESVR